MTNEMHSSFNPLNAELNTIRHLLALVRAPHIVHVSRIRVNQLLFYTFLSALHVSNESSRSSSGARHNILYYTVWYNRYNRAIRLQLAAARLA